MEHEQIGGSAQSMILGQGDDRVENSEEESEDSDSVNEDVLGLASQVHLQVQVHQEDASSDTATIPVLDDSDVRERELLD